MKASDFIKEYGVKDEPVYGISKAAIRKDTSNIANQTKRFNNSIKNQQDELDVKQQQAARSEKRKRLAPTGIPSRWTQPPEQQQ